MGLFEHAGRTRLNASLGAGGTHDATKGGAMAMGQRVILNGEGSSGRQRHAAFQKDAQAGRDAARGKAPAAQAARRRGRNSCRLTVREGGERRETKPLASRGVGAVQGPRLSGAILYKDSASLSSTDAKPNS
jgi:hypothetical protein